MELIAGVADHVEQHLPGQEDPERVRMPGHDGDSDREDSSLNNSLRWAEGEGGPWGGIGREMIRPMKESEELGMMHQAMRPVEPGVVHQDGENDTSKKPAPRVRMDIQIQLGPSHSRRFNRQNANEAKDQDGPQRVEHFTPDVLRLGKTLHDLAMVPASAKAHITKHPSDTRKDRVT